MKVAIRGGGIAGCIAGIVCLLNGDEVTIYEAKKMPRHKVCGEYVSLESVPLIEQLLGVSLSAYPLINRYIITDLTSGQEIKGHLPLGGFGISRYLMDNLLMERFKELGGSYLQQERLTVNQTNSLASADGTILSADRYIDASGKGSAVGKVEKYVGIKYHIHDACPDDNIRLFLFAGGYFGTSVVEGGKRCVCFLVKQSLLAKHLLPADFARAVLHKYDLVNYERSEIDKVHYISNFHFGTNSGAINIGDARQLVPPLAGNGMSLAIATGLDCLSGRDESIYDRANVIKKLHSVAYTPWGANILTNPFTPRLIRQTLIGETHGSII